MSSYRIPSLQIVTLSIEELDKRLEVAAEKGATIALQRLPANRTPSKEPDDNFLTVAQTARRLGIQPRTVHQWAKRGKLKKYKDKDGNTRFRASDVAALFEQQQRN